MSQAALRQVLVVDDEASMRAALQASFLRHGWRVETAVGAADAMTRFRRRPPDLVVTDMRMPDGDGLAVIRQIRALAPQTAIILLTAFGSVPDAVAAMQSGACDYLVKPVAFEQLERTAERILERVLRRDGPKLVRRDERFWAEKQGASRDGNPFVGDSVSLGGALARARQAAASDADILLEAESGTGKELLARLIHGLSPRRDRAFVAVNCAAFPETLLESELFGHTRGAFTGAVATKPGKFELADGGTLLLDEVGEMPLTLQPKLLRVLQEREFEPLGATRSTRVDVRVIATTNRGLEAMVAAGSFRADLYYRLNVIPLSLPALRHRPEDIAALAEHFARLYAPAGRPLPRLGKEFLARLEAHDWPGNVRELANLMRRTLALFPNHDESAAEIGIDALEGCALAAPAARGGDRLQAGLSLGEMERRLFEVTLDATGGNRSRAAAMLGVSLRTVRNKIRGYGLPPRAGRRRELCP
jgi:DNA-binding NtrC family response regulator